MPDKLVWISGASSGIGQALASSVPWPGAQVFNISRRRAASPEVENIQADLATPEGWERVKGSFELELARFEGELAVFIHCAATLGPIGFAGEQPPEEYERAILLDSAAPQVLGAAFIRALSRSKACGLLVMMTSGASYHLYEGWSAYAAGKASVDQWVRTVGAEQQRRDGRCKVVGIVPGIVETPMQEQIRDTRPEDFPWRDRFVALHRRGAVRKPREVAAAIWSTLGSPEARNGAIIQLR